MFAQEDIARAIRIRHHIHENPEIKYEEHKTASLVAEELKRLGYDVQTGIAKTGVVGLLQGKEKGPVIAFRADMDALPIVERTNLSYQSQIKGKMHACGHDGHTATLLLAASWIAKNKEHLKGTIKLIFQPAEEGGNGAALMIEEGVLDNPKVDAIFGYHNRPGYEEKMVFAKTNSAMCGNDTYIITIKGKSGHSSMPNRAIDPIYIAACIIQQTQGIVGKLKSPLHAGVITITQFQAGTADNVIPAEATFTLSIRSDSPECRSDLISNLENLIKGCCLPFGADYTIEHKYSIPALVNKPQFVDIVLKAARVVLPHHRIEKIDYLPTMGGEDFAFYLNQIDGCFFFVGNGQSSYLHNDDYNFNDEILHTAASVFVGIAKHYCF